MNGFEDASFTDAGEDGMTNEEQAVLVMQGLITQLSPEQQKLVLEYAAKLMDDVAKQGAPVILAIALTGAKLAAKN